MEVTSNDDNGDDEVTIENLEDSTKGKSIGTFEWYLYTIVFFLDGKTHALQSAKNDVVVFWHVILKADVWISILE